MDWRKRELDKLLREEFDKRGFYFIRDGIGIMSAPMINGFKTHTAVERYLRMESVDYDYVAYKNLSATVDEAWHTKRHNFTACLFIKVGSNDNVFICYFMACTLCDKRNSQLPILRKKNESRTFRIWSYVEM